MTVLVSGVAGFIGFHLAKKLLKVGMNVVGIDNLNDYYDVNLKEARLNILKKEERFSFYKISLEDRKELSRVFSIKNISKVVNLAAQAGVRYSITNPHIYATSNLMGFLNILEECRNYNVKHLVFASSSSVYGLNKKIPFSESDSVDHPVSLYAATKKSNELMAHTYAHLYKIPCTGLRFFTVYGPWGRPDMAPFLFTKAIQNKKSIDVYNYGKMKRDFTYIDDVVDGIIGVLSKAPHVNSDWNGLDLACSCAPYRIYNIGNSKPTGLLEFISEIEKCLNKKAEKRFLPMQQGDVEETFADISALQKAIGFEPKVSIQDGVKSFVDWYLEYYGD